jgi:hypothetical protein
VGELGDVVVIEIYQDGGGRIDPGTGRGLKSPADFEKVV